MSITLRVQFERTLPSLKVFTSLGLLAAVAAIVHVAFTDAEAKQPWALLALVLGLPGIWAVILLCLAAYSLRITDEAIEKVLVNRWVIASKSLRALRSAAVVQNTLQLRFADGSTIRLAAMPLRDQALLESVLSERCPDLQVL